MSGVLREGIREIGRKWRRTQLRRRIAAADRERIERLRALGQRAWESRTPGSAADELADRITSAEAQEKEVASRLSALDEQKKTLEARRQAEGSRFASLEEEVQKQKAPVDADLAARRATLGQAQREADAAKKRLAEIADAGEKTEIEARLQALNATIGAAPGEIARLEEQARSLQAEFDRIAGEQKQALGEIDRALAEVRRAVDTARTEGASVGTQKAKHFIELGGKLAAAGTADPALAAEMASVRATEQTLAGLQSAFQTLVAESKTMPSGTMVKFSALALVGILLVSTGAYATGRVLSMRSTARVQKEKGDLGRRMPSIVPPAATQPRQGQNECEPLRTACQRAQSWLDCAQSHLGTMLRHAAQAQADAGAEMATAQAQGRFELPGLPELLVALNGLMQKLAALQTGLVSTAAEVQIECAKLPGPQDQGECRRAAQHVDELVDKARETLKRDLEQEISLLEASTAAAAASTTRTRLLANLRGTLPLFETCK